MDSGAKVRAQLLKERDEQAKRAAKHEVTIVALIEDRTKLKESLKEAQGAAGSGGDELRRLRGQKEALEGLCRALQVSGVCVCVWGMCMWEVVYAACVLEQMRCCLQAD